MLKVGIIGCGSIAKQRHGYEYFHNSDVEIKGFYDLIPERAQALVDLYGGKVYAGVDELLADPEIDAVSVCMANAFHAEISIKALKADKHVLCEKPMAVSLEECEAMVAAAKENGKRLMIGHNQRLAPAHKKAKEILSSGALGTVTTSWTHYGEECNATTLFCEKGIMKLYADPQYSLKIVNADGTQVLYALDRLQTNDDAQQASSGVIDEFVAAVEEGRPSILDAEDIVRSMRAVFACLRSAEAEKAVAL